MPEGDTIHRSAQNLARVLSGRVVNAASGRGRLSVGLERVVGQVVEGVEARGKHLLMEFSPSRLTLHTHLMMAGSWHLYRSGQSWRKPRRQATVVLDVPDWVAVCFSAGVCELLTSAQVAVHPSLASLGPDAVAEGTDLDEARRRLDARADWTIGEALLDQRVLAGVGNVFKCEVLFLHGVDPWSRVGDLPGPTRDALLATAEHLLKVNAESGSVRRTTTGTPSAPGPGGRLAVYGRARRACRRCASPVRVARQGSQARLTYWCPRCQPSAEGTAAAGKENTRRPRPKPGPAATPLARC